VAPSKWRAETRFGVVLLALLAQYRASMIQACTLRFLEAASTPRQRFSASPNSPRPKQLPGRV